MRTTLITPAEGQLAGEYLRAGVLGFSEGALMGMGVAFGLGVIVGAGFPLVATFLGLGLLAYGAYELYGAYSDRSLEAGFQRVSSGNATPDDVYTMSAIGGGLIGGGVAGPGSFRVGRFSGASGRYTVSYVAAEAQFRVLGAMPRSLSAPSGIAGTNPEPLVQVTSWAESGSTPDLTPGRWVMRGGPTLINYHLSGLSGPTLRGTRIIMPGAPFENSITGYVPGSWVRWPTGLEFFKGFFGQRVLRP